MSAQKPITIIGGGLAGLTLGIGLRQRSIPVTLCEAGHYPRHRVCGEFISGRGQQVLAQLGLREVLVRAGACEATTTAFFSARAASPIRQLPAPALCLSRYSLDQLLAEEFRRAGGKLKENSRWQENDFAEGVVRATGRRLQPMDHGWRWFGLKVHAREARLAADLELHLLPSGYVGLCRLGDDEVNVCGLFRRRAEKQKSSRSWQEILRGPAGSFLNEHLADAVFEVDSFCSVAGLSLAPQRASDQSECRLGDSLTMIAPLTGNGMSMAFEAAEMAIEPLVTYSRGEIPWVEAQHVIARSCDETFARRLTWAAWLQRLMLIPQSQNALVSLVPRGDWFWQFLFARTR